MAAPFEHDSSWYRAELLEEEGDKAHLYYVDFGDSDWVEEERRPVSQVSTVRIIQVQKHK